MEAHKLPEPKSLPSAPFKNDGELLVIELSVLISWYKVVVFPIFKKGLRHLCINYRGINLLPMASKLLFSVTLPNPRKIGSRGAG